LDSWSSIFQNSLQSLSALLRVRIAKQRVELVSDCFTLRFGLLSPKDISLVRLLLNFKESGSQIVMGLPDRVAPDPPESILPS
jgi:hypothetical protein